MKLARQRCARQRRQSLCNIPVSSPDDPHIRGENRDPRHETWIAHVINQMAGQGFNRGSLPPCPVTLLLHHSVYCLQRAGSEFWGGWKIIALCPPWSNVGWRLGERTSREAGPVGRKRKVQLNDWLVKWGDGLRLKVSCSEHATLALDTEACEAHGSMLLPESAQMNDGLYQGLRGNSLHPSEL